VTDIAKINAISVVFPEACNILCHFHIDKNVKAMCKMIVHLREAWDQVMGAWESVVDCSDENQLQQHVEAFQVICSPWPVFIDYVNANWLIPRHGQIG